MGQDEFEIHCREDIEETGGSTVLAKSFHDPFSYAVRLKTGESFKFEYASRHDDWIHFTGIEYPTDFPDSIFQANPSIDRGLEVRIEMVAWIADGH
jgi:hypothetical protein